MIEVEDAVVDMRKPTNSQSTDCLNFRRMKIKKLCIVFSLNMSGRHILIVKSNLKNNEGMSFVDTITPSDIAFVISVIKNSRHVWDQTIRMTGLQTEKNETVVY